ncbi:MAG: GTPase Era [Bacteroidota bacterium]
MEQQPHKAGFVSIIGRPNVGKSTLLNTLVGERIAITTPKAQTTRHQLRGICHGSNFQVVYTDTPGILTPTYALQKHMMQAVYDALAGVDVLLWVVDVYTKYDQAELPARIRAKAIPTLLLINKIDLVSTAQLAKIMHDWKARARVSAIIPIAALQSLNTAQVLEHILAYLPEHPPYYPSDMLTDKPTRFFAAEIVREQLLRHYRQEVPYSTEVVIESFKETETIVKISATIYVERASQKAILIGHQGKALKKVGIAARQVLEQFLGKRVFLAQHVKVLAGWRNKEQLLQRLAI